MVISNNKAISNDDMPFYMLDWKLFKRRAITSVSKGNGRWQFSYTVDWTGNYQKVSVGLFGNIYIYIYACVCVYINLYI